MHIYLCLVISLCHSCCAAHETVWLFLCHKKLLSKRFCANWCLSHRVAHLILFDKIRNWLSACVDTLTSIYNIFRKYRLLTKDLPSYCLREPCWSALSILFFCWGNAFGYKKRSVLCRKVFVRRGVKISLRTCFIIKKSKRAPSRWSCS